MTAFLAILGTAACMTAKAGDANTQITVGATVLRHLGMRVLTAPRTIEISAADVVRGYVDMPSASTLEIRSNNPGGYALAIESQAEFLRGTEVRSNGRAAALHRTGGVLSFQSSGRGMQMTPVALSFRIFLFNDTHPGIYPWPIHISVLPV